MDSRNRSSDVFGGGDVTSGGMVLHSKKLEYIASYMEIGSQRCILGKHCTSKDLRHIITAHGGNLASDLTKGGLVIGYHQTSAEIAAKIVHSDILPGTSGALGPGVYFAPTLDMTNGKAHRLGCVVVAIVDIGNPDIVTNWHPHFTGESQKRRGFDSTVGVAGSGSIKRPEFVVYDSGRVLRFATCTLDTAQAGTKVVHSRDAYEANEGAFAEAWGKEKFPELADIFTKLFASTKAEKEKMRQNIGKPGACPTCGSMDDATHYGDCF